MTSTSQPTSGQPISAAVHQDETAKIQAVLQDAVALHQKGQFVRAQAMYQVALKLRPRDFDALHLSGVLAAQLKNNEQAVALIGQALLVNPNSAAAHFNYGLALADLGRWQAAADSYKNAIRCKGDYAEAYNNQGNALSKLGQYQSAIDSYDGAIRINDDFAEAYNSRGVAFYNLSKHDAALNNFDAALRLRADYAEAHFYRGLALNGLGRFHAALESYDNAIQFEPGNAAAYNNRGILLGKLNWHLTAIESYDKAIQFKADFVEAHINRGVSLRELRQFHAAIKSYDNALQIEPNHSGAYNNRGVALFDLRLLPAAIASYDKAIQFSPDNANAYNNRGMALDYLRHYNEAVESYNRAVDLDPSFADAWSNRGTTLADLGRRAEAVQSYKKAIEINPDHADAHWNMSLCFLQLGNFKRGWAGYEWRWKLTDSELQTRTFAQPLWLGESLIGKTILLHADEGFGDALQFCRYAPLLHYQGARVVLEVRNPLVSLLAHLKGVAEVVAYGDVLPSFDVHCPMGSLPRAFNADANTIPLAAGYLRSTAKDLDKWRSKLGDRNKPLIGLAWSGNRKHGNDHNRSVALADLARALPSGFEYVSLQKEMSEADQAVLKSRPDISTFSAELTDFTDTAALCDLVDVVVSVDTSVVHLAGALGRPVWVLLPFNPDWRWLLDRTDSPWYDSTKLYRQERPGDWQSVFERIRTDLESLRTL
jgi:tetratricopeptide (TPR) repeat protein